MAGATYHITETLRQDASIALYRAVRDDGLNVVLKVLGPERCRARDIERFEDELEAGRALAETPGVVHPLALDRFEGRPAMVLEDVRRPALARLCGRPMVV